MSYSDQIEQRFQDNSGAQAILLSCNLFLAGVGLSWDNIPPVTKKSYIMREHCAHGKSGPIPILARVDRTANG
jgi:hypothetical protein